MISGCQSSLIRLWVIRYVFGKRKDVVFKELKALLSPFNISRYYTDDWGLMIVILMLSSMK